MLAVLRGAISSGQLDDFLDHPEPRQWVGFSKVLLNQLRFETGDEDGRILGTPFRLLDLSDWLDATRADGAPLDHPFLSDKARAWRARAQKDPGYEWLLGQPAWVGDVVTDALFAFAPDLSFVRFSLPGLERVVTTGSTSRTPAELVRILTVYSVVLRASGAGFDPNNRLCHHQECPEFAGNFCSTFPAIPEDFRDCQFTDIHREASREVGMRA